MQINKLALLVTLLTTITLTPARITAQKPPSPEEARALTVRADIQEANSETGVITARGNVQLFYPARQIQATAAQAQYFTKERRIVLTGNVFVLQQGNTLRGETVTYLIDEARFVALPQSNRQVESVYLVTDPKSPKQPAPPTPKTGVNRSNNKNPR